jgi:hypothetical protein
MMIRLIFFFQGIWAFQIMGKGIAIRYRSVNVFIAIT